MSTKVWIDPACNILYSSFYILGLQCKYGKKNIHFSNKKFRALNYTKNTHILAFIINNKRYVIDFADSNKTYYNSFLEWTDIYGKVNYNINYLPHEYITKIVKVGTNFAINYSCFTMINALLYGLYNYSKCFKRIHFSLIHYLARYYSLSKRRISEQVNYSVDEKFIFHISLFWPSQDQVNRNRTNFIRACKRLENEGEISFKGGLVVSHCPSANYEKDIAIKNRINYNDYLSYLNKSLLVFNTPAYFQCHGWKLPEFLSQGKIILSTSFINELPIQMEHGKHIYFTGESEDEIYNSIKIIINDSSLQNKLKSGSTEYWQKYANPLACISLFIDNNK